ncbi:cytochrome C assembly protein [Methanosarcinales archaeon]|nr:MAG: cytochrome C assembly protein [Methanosarcinales archaeon]
MMISTRDILLCIAAAVSVGASYAAYLWAPPEATMGDLYRILYVHAPVAWVCYLAFFISFLASITYLAKRRRGYDGVAEVSAVLGLVYGAIALISGSIWAKAAWGSYWNWDPRETTTLILWIAYMGYISLKLSIGSIEKRAIIGAVYNILAFATIPLSYLSIMLLPSLHPQIATPTEIFMTPTMTASLFLCLIAASLFFVYLLITTFTVWSLEDRVNVLIHEKGGVEKGNV